MARTLGVAVLLVALQTQSTLSRAWRTVQDLVIERPGVIGVTLPEETLDAARPALEDLRILDPTGKEVPWTIEVHTHTPTAARRPAQMHTLLHPESTEVLLATESDAPVAGVELTVASEDFVKAARVEESADGRTWKVVREDEVLFRSPGGPGKTSLELPPLPRAHLRVILDDRRSRPVPVTGVTLLGASPAPPATEPLEIEVTERREEQGETRFFLRFSGRHARLAEISLETPEPVFTRPAELSQAAGESREFLSRSLLYRKPLGGRRPAEQLSIGVDATLTAREAVLSVDNGDSPPLRVDRIRARAHPVRLVFVATTGGLYHLLAGNSEAALPRYDVGALGESGASRIPVFPGPIRVNPAWHPAEPLPGVPTLGAPLDVGDWRFRKKVVLGPGELHELELDPDVLSAAGPAGTDLRLVREGRQVAYVRDHPPRLRTLEVSARREEPRPRSKRSRWALELPYSRLPIERISCDAEEKFFRRGVLLVEESRDGERLVDPVILGRAVWARTPGESLGRLDLELGRPPRTRRIILEVEDGDNPPLTPTAFRAHYAAPKLLFKTSPGPGLFLYYGNRTVAAPDYDLYLLSSTLSASERVLAALGPEELLKGSRASQDSADRWGTFVLWTVLVALVVALTAIMVRLLPRQDQKAPDQAR